MATGILSPDEVVTFIPDFMELELKDFCEISFAFNYESYRGKSCCLVNITVRDENGECFLRKSFEGGMLNHWGWNKKFTLLEKTLTGTPT